jgi:hydrogenase nickel incorporation protein HypA/HybF
MHELAITRNVVSIVADHANGRPVKRVVLEVGRLSGVMADAITFCFDIVAEGTALEGAALEIRHIDGRARCRCCGAEFAQAALFTPCPCGARDSERIAGEELNVKEYELAQAAEYAPEAGLSGAKR